MRNGVILVWAFSLRVRNAICIFDPIEATESASRWRKYTRRLARCCIYFFRFSEPGFFRYWLVICGYIIQLEANRSYRSHSHLIEKLMRKLFIISFSITLLIACGHESPQLIFEDPRTQHRAEITPANCSYSPDEDCTKQIINQYRWRISEKIRSNTRTPPGLNGKPEVVLELTLDAKGTVQRVRVLQSGGKADTDRAVINGVMKSSPLPVPMEEKIQREFQQLVIRYQFR